MEVAPIQANASRQAPGTVRPPGLSVRIEVGLLPFACRLAWRSGNLGNTSQGNSNRWTAHYDGTHGTRMRRLD